MNEPPPPLMGTAEVAARLGVSRPRVSKLRERDDFPKPYVVLAMGPVWKTPAIERYVKRSGR